ATRSATPRFVGPPNGWRTWWCGSTPAAISSAAAHQVFPRGLFAAYYARRRALLPICMSQLQAHAPELPTGTLTLMLTDIEGSTRMWERYATPMRVAMRRHDQLIEAIV